MSIDNNTEIQLIEIIKDLLKNKKKIILISVIFMILGIIIALLSPVKYTSSTIFVPQISSGVNNSNLSTIASIAGFKLDNNISNNEISPNIYPLIINSYNFKNQLLNTQISFGNNIKLKEYLLNISDSPLKILYNYTFGLPTYLKKII